MRFAIVVSRYNQNITQRLLKGALSVLQKKDFVRAPAKIVWVPGAFEIPITALKLARSRTFDAVICLGCVLKGATQHNRYISESVAHGITSAALQSGVPITFGVLTPDTIKQAQQRSQKNSANKGVEAAEAAVKMALLMSKLKK